MSSVSTSILPRKRSEKTQCQALELPLESASGHGTITLFAANYRDGKLISRTGGTPMWSGCVSSSRSNGKHPSRWPFTSLSTTTVLISMNVSAVGSTVIQRPLPLHADREPWLNLVERFFGRSHQRCDSRGSFRSVPELVPPSNHLADRNADPQRSAYKRRSNRQDPTSQRGSGQR